MREPIRDNLRLIHIAQACDRLLEYFPGGIVTELDPKSMNYFGLIKNLEIIGEASYMLTHEFKESHKDTDWRSIVAMRHLMVHGYYNINPMIVKEIIESEILNLRTQIHSYLTT